MNRFVDILNRPEPTLAVSFTEVMNDNVIRDIGVIADVAEFRADKFSSSELEDLAQQARRLAALPLLLTIRFGAEGGEWTATEEERLELFTKLLPYADAVDIELAAPILPEVIEAAREQDKVVIISSHNFDFTPPTEILEDKLAEAIEMETDYVKFAASARTSEEYQRLVDFTLKNQEEGLIVVAMDSYGPLSRIVLVGIGSCLTYAFPGKEAIAPGQLGYLETHELLKKLYPDYAKLFK